MSRSPSFASGITGCASAAPPAKASARERTPQLACPIALLPHTDLPAAEGSFAVCGVRHACALIVRVRPPYVCSVSRAPPDALQLNLRVCRFSGGKDGRRAGGARNGILHPRAKSSLALRAKCSYDGIPTSKTVERKALGRNVPGRPPFAARPRAREESCSATASAAWVGAGKYAISRDGDNPHPNCSYPRAAPRFPPGLLPARREVPGRA